MIPTDPFADLVPSTAFAGFATLHDALVFYGGLAVVIGSIPATALRDRLAERKRVAPAWTVRSAVWRWLRRVWRVVGIVLIIVIGIALIVTAPVAVVVAGSMWLLDRHMRAIEDIRDELRRRR